MGMMIDALIGWARGERGYEKPSDGSFSGVPDGRQKGNNPAVNWRAQSVKAETSDPEKSDRPVQSEIVDKLIAAGLKLRHDDVVRLNADRDGRPFRPYLDSIEGDWVFIYGKRRAWRCSFWRQDCPGIVREFRNRIASIRRY
jgi:hypothetical protein